MCLSMADLFYRDALLVYSPGGGFCQFPLIRSDDTSSHMKLDRAIEFLWKTDLFKNRTKVAILSLYRYVSSLS